MDTNEYLRCATLFLLEVMKETRIIYPNRHPPSESSSHSKVYRVGEFVNCGSWE
jgi:hypothetical protein